MSEYGLSQFLVVVLFTVIAAVGMATLPSAAKGSVKPHGLFTDGALLQRDMPVPVWGTAADGEKVTVSFQGQTVSTVARDGRWMVRLQPLKAGGPYSMKISGSNTIILKDILVGDVWVCSGQSNMEWWMELDPANQVNTPGKADSKLRLYSVPFRTSDTPVLDIESKWQRCNPEALKLFSAVGYYFGRDLRKALKVPVGMIMTAYGGTHAESWTNPKTFRDRPDLMGVAPEAMALDKVHNPGVLWNAMVVPLQPYAIKGVIWYQGESNAYTAFAYQYRELFPELIQDWREGWGQADFPFLFVQLAPFFQASLEVQEHPWPEVQEAQLVTSRTVPNTGMVVVTDAGDEYDIHPIYKETVGARLAILARGMVYGERIVYSGPIYRSMQIDGDKIVLSFDHVGSGLVARDGNLKGFSICGEDRKFVRARAVIEGDKVIVSNTEVVPKPIAVRFGWASYPIVNLYNKEGLPASPFRTDDFPLTTQPK